MVALLVLTTSVMRGQESIRKVKSKVSPIYPELAQRLKVVGSVKLDVTIDATGTVTIVKPVGGHPLLIDSASKAMKAWKFEPGAESTEVIEFVFKSQ